MRIGYARVSSDTPDYTAQVEALKTAGCKRIYSEKASGKSTSGRPELAKLLRALAPGDVMMVTKIDRVARSALDLLHIVRTEIAGRQCGFVSLGDSWCDTTSEMGRFMLTVMSGIAELERDLIRKRCQAGIERAKEKGVSLADRAHWALASARKLRNGMVKERPWLHWLPTTKAGGQTSTVPHTARWL